jgi:hypothetical protein
LSEEEKELRSALKSRAVGLAVINRVRARQRARLKWLKLGDANTKFFHSRATHRRAKNRIHTLHSDAGIATTPTELEETIFHHLHSFMGTSLPCSEHFDWTQLNLPKPDLSDLTRPFTMDELKTAVFESPPDKSPGPDGFSGGFFRASWSVIKEDLLAATNKFYDLNDPSFDSLNTAFVILLPKKDQPSHMSHFRPISLIHAFGKLISKILALRLQPHLDDLISPCQSAFITGRNIQDNFLYVQTAAKQFHKSKTPTLLLKLDLAKAFDTVSWEYIIDMLEARGFPLRWRNWIALLFRTASSRVLVNGVPGRYIHHRRGLRQGDALSPFLFDLAIEPLHRLLEIATNEGILSKIKGRHCTFRTSLYADDVALFLNPTQQDIAGLTEILSTFGRATGLITNLAKSSISTICCQDIDIQDLASRAGIVITPFPCLYLGMPLSIKNLTKADWQALLDKLDRHLASWKARLMSKAGRLEMLNTVLTSLAVYMMTINKMPAWVKKEFDKRRRAWLWAGEANCSGGKCKVSWKKVCRPKHLGGLGIHCIESFGTALRLRWMWQKWKHQDKPWAHMTLPSTPKERALFAAATNITIGNGQTARFWTDRWLHGMSPKDLAPQLFKIAIRKNRTVHEALTDGKWLQDLRFALDESHSTELMRLEVLISDIHLTDERDEIIWVFGNKNHYTTKSAYQLQFLGAVGTDFKKTIWRGWAPARCKFFIWSLMLDSVPTADKLLQRGCENEYFCPLCRRNLETAEHLLIDCPFSRKVWSHVASCLNVSILAPEAWHSCSGGVAFGAARRQILAQEDSWRPTERHKKDHFPASQLDFLGDLEGAKPPYFQQTRTAGARVHFENYGGNRYLEVGRSPRSFGSAGYWNPLRPWLIA